MYMQYCFTYHNHELFIEMIGFQSVGVNYHSPVIYGEKLRTLREKFQKARYISRTEAEHLAKTLILQPEQVVGWFHRQREKGTCRLLTVERDTSLITLIFVFWFTNSC